MKLPSLHNPGFAIDAIIVAGLTLVLIAVANAMATPAAPSPPPATPAS